MSQTIGLVCNFWNEANALPGFLETHANFFDHIAFLQSGPNGAESTDGSIELLEKWKMPLQRGSINDGFGVVRTQALRMSPCDWVMLLDADERFHSHLPVMTCVGESTPQSAVDVILQEYDHRDLKTLIPNWENVGSLGVKLRVEFGETSNQGGYLRGIINRNEPTCDAIITIRRHWHDFSWDRPTQNWWTDHDWQMRCVRNKESIRFDGGVKMHERLVGFMNAYRATVQYGPFFDHYHLHFKRMEMEQRRHDVQIYNAINRGEVPPTTPVVS